MRTIDISSNFPIWSPLGNLFVFWGKDPNAGDPTGLNVVNLDGSGHTFVSSLMSGYPSWSPDGTRIAFTCSDVKPASVCTSTLDGLISKMPLAVNGVIGPVWSPSGDSIAFTSGESAYVVPLNGKGIRKLASGVEYAVSWGEAVIAR